jgi:hypothetical protein
LEKRYRRHLVEIVIAGPSSPPAAGVRCPICAEPNEPARFCRHVRWTFNQGGPLDFAAFAIETSPYVRARGHGADDIPRAWFEEHGDSIVDCVLLHFEAVDGFVFGAIADVDLLARDIWREFNPEQERPELERIDAI